MALTSAERQKRYRQKKKGDSVYMAKERARQKKNYVKIECMSAKVKNKRRQDGLKRWKKWKSNKIHAEDNSTGPASIPIDGQSADDQIHPSAQPYDPRNRTRKRISRAVSEANRKIKKLEKENTDLKKNADKYRKRYERQNSASKAPPTTVLFEDFVNEIQASPMSAVKKDLTTMGLSTKNVPKNILKKLVFNESVITELQVCRKLDSDKKGSTLNRILSGKVMKKYRLHNMSRKKFNFSATRKDQCPLSQSQTARLCRNQVIYNLKKSVTDFFECDDVTLMCPGKKDAVKVGSVKVQKRLLNDYMKNVYAKFCSEFPFQKLSYTTFTRMRPTYVKLVNFFSRNACLCKYHQNYALPIECIHNLGIKITSKDPEYFLRWISTECGTGKEDIIVFLKSLCPDNLPNNIVFSMWDSVVDEKGKKKVKVVSVSNTQNDFFKHFAECHDSFSGHSMRVANQFSAVKSLKSLISSKEALVQMDFAENYTCVSLDEIQSAYWGQTQVTIHPIVVYLGCEEAGKPQYMTFVLCLVN